MQEAMKSKDTSAREQRQTSVNTSHDFIEFSKSLNMDVLSPDVKEFLRKNRIRVRKESN